MNQQQRREQLSAKRERFDETVEVKPTRTPRVFALPCPYFKNHDNSRVYRTNGVHRYCVCDECGGRWRQTGPEAGGEPEGPLLLDSTVVIEQPHE